MTSNTADPVVSGVPYAVRHVDGQEPLALEDFVGDHEVLLEGQSGTHVVLGQGVVDEGGFVRLHEKDAVTSKDVRPWRVSVDDGDFVAVSSVF